MRNAPEGADEDFAAAQHGDELGVGDVLRHDDPQVRVVPLDLIQDLHHAPAVLSVQRVLLPLPLGVAPVRRTGRPAAPEGKEGLVMASAFDLIGGYDWGILLNRMFCFLSLLEFRQYDTLVDLRHVDLPNRTLNWPNPIERRCGRETPSTYPEKGDVGKAVFVIRQKRMSRGTL